MGLSPVLVHRAHYNPEIGRVAKLLGQLCERLHGLPASDDGPRLDVAGRAQILGTLGQCEMELEKLHALAAAAQAMIDEAHAAFGFNRPERAMRVQCDYDSTEPAPISPSGNGARAAAAPKAKATH